MKERRYFLSSGAEDIGIGRGAPTSFENKCLYLVVWAVSPSFTVTLPFITGNQLFIAVAGATHVTHSLIIKTCAPIPGKKHITDFCARSPTMFQSYLYVVVWPLGICRGIKSVHASEVSNEEGWLTISIWEMLFPLSLLVAEVGPTRAMGENCQGPYDNVKVIVCVKVDQKRIA